MPRPQFRLASINLGHPGITPLRRLSAKVRESTLKFACQMSIESSARYCANVSGCVRSAAVCSKYRLALRLALFRSAWLDIWRAGVPFAHRRLRWRPISHETAPVHSHCRLYCDSLRIRCCCSRRSHHHVQTGIAPGQIGGTSFTDAFVKLTMIGDTTNVVAAIW